MNYFHIFKREVCDNLRIYNVKSGDTLDSVSKNFNIPTEDIIQDNHLFTDNNLLEGQSLIITENKRHIDVNGYVYPYINSDTLYATLPYLTYISVFSYEFTESGDLINLNDTNIIDSALKANVEPLLVLTNSKNNGSFDSDWAHMLLTNDVLQETLINNLLEVMLDKGYYGVNVDFEYVYPEDRVAYNLFLVKVANAMHRQDLILTTAVAPKVSDAEGGILKGAIDYEFHGKVADKVIIMTYEWGYRNGEPMAIAPVNQVERVLSYAVSVMPSEKILMGIPNYGYDWEIPFIKGRYAKSISNTDAYDLAKKKQVPISFNEISKAPYFRYNENDQMHEVWFEDARSIEAKLELVQKYNLGGISYWNLMNYFTQNFKILEETYKINKF